MKYFTTCTTLDGQKMGMDLDAKKRAAIERYKTARSEYMEALTKESWIRFCDCKRECMLLGCRI